MLTAHSVYSIARGRSVGEMSALLQDFVETSRVRESAVLALIPPSPVTYSLGLLRKKLFFCLKTSPA